MLTRSGICGDRNLCQNWLKSLPNFGSDNVLLPAGATPFSLTNVDFSLMCFCDIHLRAIFHLVPKLLFCTMSLKIMLSIYCFILQGQWIKFMMTSSNGNIFHVTGHLCWEFTCHPWIPRTKASDAELWCFLWSALNKQLSKQSWGWWFETPSRPLWRHCNVRMCYNETALC